MKRSILFYITATIAIFCILLAVYYMIPGIYHPFVAFSDGGLYLVSASKRPHFVNSPHHMYAAGFFFLTVLFALVAFLFWRRRAVRTA